MICSACTLKKPTSSLASISIKFCILCWFTFSTVSVMFRPCLFLGDLLSPCSLVSMSLWSSQNCLPSASIVSGKVRPFLLLGDLLRGWDCSVAFSLVTGKDNCSPGFWLLLFGLVLLGRPCADGGDWMVAFFNWSASVCCMSFSSASFFFSFSSCSSNWRLASCFSWYI